MSSESGCIDNTAFAKVRTLADGDRHAIGLAGEGGGGSKEREGGKDKPNDGLHVKTGAKESEGMTRGTADEWERGTQNRCLILEPVWLTTAIPLTATRRTASTQSCPITT
jgi:hypothetical protein